MQTNSSNTLLVADEKLNFQEIRTTDPTPNGSQILLAAGRDLRPEVQLVQLLTSGEMENIRLDEHPNLATGHKFVISCSDRSYFFTVDGTKLEWPHRYVSSTVIRRLAKVSDDFELVYKRNGGQETVLDAIDLVDLDAPGVEQIVTRLRVWRLKVQGVLLDYAEPLVKVGDAMRRAGFDPSKAWHIFLIVQDQPKREVTVDFIVDLRTPGIEKIRLMQRNVDNGEGPEPKLAREFDLLDADEQYLDRLNVKWETVVSAERRWVLIHDYLLPQGYVPAVTCLALDIPKDYPAAQIDMFYFSPWVARADGQAIPSTQVRAVINGLEYQGWSRHRNGSAPWDPHSDNVATHLALVESCLAREMGE
ncbi:multiubiquitin domain-containing protein [Ralstonia pseudosolanacearum]